MPESGDQVALLIDFENLVYGILNGPASSASAAGVDPEVLIKLCEEYGQVVLANAYADWRNREVNQYQTELYGLGVDLIHVFGKNFKNAVDVKMAVDATHIMFTLPHIKTYVIVSGDRDFIHVLKSLRRYGKTVVGVSPQSSASDDFASLCDRFVRYESIATAYSQGSAIAEPSRRTDMQAVAHVLDRILQARPEGIKGASIKPILRREIGSTFDESEFGYSRLSDMLRDMPSVVRVVSSPDGGDVTVLSAGSDVDIIDQPITQSPQTSVSILLSQLRKYRFEQNVDKRRRILTALYECISEAAVSFSWIDVASCVIERDDMADLSLSVTIMGQYQMVFWQSKAFEIESGQQNVPMRERKIRLIPSISDAETLVRFYEESIVYKVTHNPQIGQSVSDEEIAEVLGLEDTRENVEYCRSLRS